LWSDNLLHFGDELSEKTAIIPDGPFDSRTPFRQRAPEASQNEPAELERDFGMKILLVRTEVQRKKAKSRNFWRVMSVTCVGQLNLHMYHARKLEFAP
jgi:hypothetical protein